MAHRIGPPAASTSRAPSEALADFIESCAAAAKPAREAMLRERGRFSKRKKEHARMMRRE